MTVHVPAQYLPILQRASAQYHVPLSGLEAQLNLESGFNPHARSPVGAMGIAQFMPGTAKTYHVNVNDPTSSIMGAAHLMSDLYAQEGHNWTKALEAYNAGPGNLGAGAGYARSLIGAYGGAPYSGGVNPIHASNALAQLHASGAASQYPNIAQLLASISQGQHMMAQGALPASLTGATGNTTGGPQAPPGPALADLSSHATDTSFQNQMLNLKSSGKGSRSGVPKTIKMPKTGQPRTPKGLKLPSTKALSGNIHPSRATLRQPSPAISASAMSAAAIAAKNAGAAGGLPPLGSPAGASSAPPGHPGKLFGSMKGVSFAGTDYGVDATYSGKTPAYALGSGTVVKIGSGWGHLSAPYQTGQAVWIKLDHPIAGHQYLYYAEGTPVAGIHVGQKIALGQAVMYNPGEMGVAPSPDVNTRVVTSGRTPPQPTGVAFKNYLHSIGIW